MKKTLSLFLFSAAIAFAQWAAIPSSSYPALDALLNGKLTYSLFSGVPSGSCTLGKDVATNALTGDLYWCTATNVWTLKGAAGTNGTNGTNGINVTDTCADASGSTTAYVCTSAQGQATTNGKIFLVKPQTTNTGSAPTLTINGVTWTLKKQGASLIAGDYIGGQWYVVVSDGSFWNVLSRLGNDGSGSVSTPGTVNTVLLANGSGGFIAGTGCTITSSTLTCTGGFLSSGPFSIGGPGQSMAALTAPASGSYLAGFDSDNAGQFTVKDNAGVLHNLQVSRFGGYEIGQQNSVVVLVTADLTNDAFIINDKAPKTLTEASCISNTGSQVWTAKIGSTVAFNITCVPKGTYSRATTDGTTGYIIAASMTTPAVPAGANSTCQEPLAAGRPTTSSCTFTRQNNMLKLALFFLAAAMQLSGACGNGYLLCRPITITATLASAIANYDLLITGNYPWMYNAANGGNVQVTTATQSVGPSMTVPADVFLATDGTCATPFPYSWKAYVLGTIASVFTKMSASTGAVVWVCYNKPADTFHGDVNATWATTYKIVANLTDINNSCGGTCTSKDSTVNANNATYAGGGGTTSVSGLAGAALGLAGSWLVFPPINSTDVAVSLWFKSSTSQTAAMFLTVSNVYPNWHPTMQLDGTGHVVFYGGSASVTCTSIFATNNVWHQAAVKIVSGLVTGYVDGVNCGSVTAAGTSGTTSIWLSASFDFADAFLGSIDLYRVRDSDISDLQIAAEYVNYLTPSSFYTVGAEQSAGSTTPRRRIF